MRVLDHCAIYLLIAGTYTPVTLVSWGWKLFGLAWGLAAVRIVFKVLAAGRFAVLSTVAYVLMDWLCIVAVKPMFFSSRRVCSHCSVRVGCSTPPEYSSTAR